MDKKAVVSLIFLAAVMALRWTPALADSWVMPSTQVTNSADGKCRVTVVPRGIKSQLAYYEDKSRGSEPAGQRKGDVLKSPMARVECRDGTVSWVPRWQKPLVNDVAPTEVLLANQGAFLVTFDNWGSAGYGDDVVVIYDRHGNIVRKLSLDQILPKAYVNQLPRSVSSRWWAGQHRLVENEQQVELQVVEPGPGDRARPRYVPVRLKLADGAVIPPEGGVWEAAMRRAGELEKARQLAWDKVRAERIRPLSAPVNNDTHAWRHYMFEIRERVARKDESMGGMVLAAPGADPGYHNAERIAGEVDDYDADAEFGNRAWIFASPTSDRLANILADRLAARRPGSMKGAHYVFVGTEAEGRTVLAAAAKTGAEITVIDRDRPVPPGEPLPESPPPFWTDRSADF